MQPSQPIIVSVTKKVTSDRQSGHLLYRRYTKERDKVTQKPGGTAADGEREEGHTPQGWHAHAGY